MRLNKIKNLYLRRAYLCLVVPILTVVLPVAALLDLLVACAVAQVETAKDFWKEARYVYREVVTSVREAWKKPESR